MLAELVAGALEDASDRRAAVPLALIEAAATARPAALDVLTALAPAELINVARSTVYRIVQRNLSKTEQQICTGLRCTVKHLGTGSPTRESAASRTASGTTVTLFESEATNDSRRLPVGPFAV